MKKVMISAYDYQCSSGSAFFTSSSSGITSGQFQEYYNNSDSLETEKGKYSIFDIANWFLLKQNMTHKKLQKLCYYAQAWSYAINGYKLADTVFEAWTHGPVSPVLYDFFKSFGFSTIKIKCSNKLIFDSKDEDLLESVWLTYGNHTGNALEALSHNELPWQEARRGYDANERCSVPIFPETMRDYYKSIYSGGNAL